MLVCSSLSLCIVSTMFCNRVCVCNSQSATQDGVCIANDLVNLSGEFGIQLFSLHIPFACDLVSLCLEDKEMIFWLADGVCK